MRSTLILAFIAAVAVPVLSGCTRPNPAYDPNPALPDECRTGVEVTETYTAFRHPDKLDILFVIDASGDDPVAVQELFANAAGPIGGLLSALDVDARAAVITTDATAEGLAGPGTIGPTCESNDKLIADVGNEDWGAVLRCNLFAAPSRNQYDQPLLAVKQLLEAPPEDFLRDDARLLIVIASRSDDCSAAGVLSGAPREACAAADLYGVNTLIDDWVAQRSRNDLGLVVFAGPPSVVGADELRPVCNATIGNAFAGNRLFDATGMLPFSGFNSVCTDDVFWPLGDAIEAFVTTQPLTLCPGELTHEPLAVSADGDAVPLGDEGFVYLGTTEDCPGGTLRFAAPAVKAVDELEITYCTPEQ